MSKKKKKGKSETSIEDSVEALAEASSEADAADPVEETVEVAAVVESSGDEGEPGQEGAGEAATEDQDADESTPEPSDDTPEPEESSAGQEESDTVGAQASEAPSDDGTEPKSENSRDTAGEGELVDGESENEPVDPDSERRQTGRKGVKLNRLIASKVVDGNSQRECYLHLVDISEGGLRVNSDDPFPDDRDFALEIGLAAFGTELATRKPRIKFPVRLVWSKSLVGGMVVSGLAFTDLDKESTDIVAAIMQGASPQGRRAHFRLNRVLGVELGGSGNERWLYPLTLDLSVEGMRICLSETLEVGAKFPLRIFLEFELPTVEAQSEVMWQEVMPSGRVQVGLKFEGMSERDAMAIKTYIDQCLEQDQSNRSM